MKKITIAALTVGTLLSYAPFSPVAHAVPNGGKLCTLTPGGVFEGGPITLVPPTNTGNMTCTVQSGLNNLYSEPDDDSVTGPTTPAAVAVVGTVTVPPSRPLYICTTVTDNDGVYNYDYTADPPAWVAAPAGECLELPWQPFGFLCGFTSTTDPTGEDNVQTGVMDGGPLVITDEYHTSPPSGSITCTIQVGANSTHAGTDAFTATGPTTPGVVVLPETQISYEAAEDENVYLCAQVNFEGGTPLYWHDSNDPLVDGAWSTSPTADCGLAISASTPGEDEFPFDVLNPILDEVFLIADPVLCAAVDLLPAAVHDILHDLLGCPAH